MGEGCEHKWKIAKGWSLSVWLGHFGLLGGNKGNVDSVLPQRLGDRGPIPGDSIGLAIKFVHFVLYDGSSNASLSLISFKTILLDCIVWQLSYQCALKKNLIKIGEFSCSHFNVEDGRKYATFSAYCRGLNGHWVSSICQKLLIILATSVQLSQHRQILCFHFTSK